MLENALQRHKNPRHVVFNRFFHKDWKFSGRLFFFLVGFYRRPTVISIPECVFRISAAEVIVTMMLLSLNGCLSTKTKMAD